MTKRRPYFEIDGRAPSITFQAIRPTSTVAASSRRAGDELQREVAEANPPPREGAAGWRRRELWRRTSVLTLWILVIVFSATTRTGFGIGWKSSFGP